MFRALLTISLVFVSFFCVGTHAQGMPLPSADQIRLYVQQQAGNGGGQARVEVSVGQLDPRLQLAPCARIEPFMPANARLWGRGSVGLRCVEGATWSVQVPVTVRIYGPALLAARPLPAQVPLTADDFTTGEVEWTREPQGVVSDAAQLENRVLSRPLALGQPVPLAALKAPLVVALGDPVKLVGQGKGFAVTADAVALAGAHDGQNVRVRTESGRVVTGIARSGRRVEVVF